MKPLTVLAFIAVLTSMSSCSKNYTCNCQGGFTQKPFSVEVQTMNEKQARDKCAELNVPQGQYGTYGCSLQH